MIIIWFFPNNTKIIYTKPCIAQKKQKVWVTEVSLQYK